METIYEASGCIPACFDVKFLDAVKRALQTPGTSAVEVVKTFANLVQCGGKEWATFKLRNGNRFWFAKNVTQTRYAGGVVVANPEIDAVIIGQPKPFPTLFDDAKQKLAQWNANGRFGETPTVSANPDRETRVKEQVLPVGVLGLIDVNMSMVPYIEAVGVTGSVARIPFPGIARRAVIRMLENTASRSYNVVNTSRTATTVAYPFGDVVLAKPSARATKNVQQFIRLTYQSFGPV